MHTIYTSPEHLTHKGPNQSFGNHMLHLFAIYHISKVLNIPFKVSDNSNLDDVLQLQQFKHSFNAPLLYSEEFGGDVDEYFEKELRNKAFITQLINGRIPINHDFQIKGWFWDADFLPDETFFDHIQIRKDKLQVLQSKSFLFEENVLVIHYRGTDFINHAIGWGDIRLRYEYYYKCINKFRALSPLSKIVVISDEPEKIINDIKADVPIVIEKNDYITDWLLLLFCKNLVCSNSSFCFTAGWHKKNIVFQPEKFFTRYLNTEKRFPINVYYKNSIVL
jgi:hypothetical protein